MATAPLTNAPPSICVVGSTPAPITLNRSSKGPVLAGIEPVVGQFATGPVGSPAAPTVATMTFSVIATSFSGGKVVETTTVDHDTMSQAFEHLAVNTASSSLPRPVDLPSPPTEPEEDDKPASGDDASADGPSPTKVPSAVPRRQVRRARRKPVPRAPAAPPTAAKMPTPPPSPKAPKQQPQQRKIFVDMASYTAWTEQGGKKCGIGPGMGMCNQQASAGSFYCHLHSCQAVNADSAMCLNPVRNPRESRYCSSGYHKENKRQKFVAELICSRQEHDKRAAVERELELEQSLLYVDEALESGTPIQSTATSPRMLPRPLPPRAASASVPCNRAPGASNLERQWGAYSDDKWWVGKWKQENVGKRWRMTMSQ